MSADQPLHHPCTVAMIEAGGVAPADYVAMTAPVYAYKTRHDIGEPTTRLLAMPTLPAHTGGYTARNEVMVSVWLTDRIRFLSGTPGDGASILMDQSLLPDILAGSLVGRQIDEVIDHPMLRGSGLAIVHVEPCAQPHRGKMRLKLADVRWRCIDGRTRDAA